MHDDHLLKGGKTTFGYDLHKKWKLNFPFMLFTRDEPQAPP